MNSAMLRSATSTASCSGRNVAPIQLRPYIFGLLASRWAARRQSAVVHALYNFSDAAETRVPGERRNRAFLKKEARNILEVVRGLTAMTPKQLAAVSHLLPPGGVEAVGIAARLPRSNQGRKRQEALVAKMLRVQLVDGDLDKLEEAVSMVEDRSGVYDDGDVSGLVATWREGLLGDDPEVVAEVYGYPREWAPDHQQLRALVRQCQQALSEERSSSQDVSPSGSGSSSGDEGGEGQGGQQQGDEDLAEALASAARRKKAASESRRSRPLLRSLSKMLRPLAVQVAREAGGQ